MITTIIIFIAILGVLIFVHEFGHFITAKKNGVKVEEFGFGFPPRIFGIKKGETIYSINLIPLGGFVKALGEDGAGRDDPQSFASKKVWQRAIILVAGIGMNFLLAIALFSITNTIGLPTAVADPASNAPDIQIQISDVAKDSPAQKAGITIGDIIIGINDQKINRVENFQEIVQNNLEKETGITVLRGTQELHFNLIPRANPPKDQGAIGVGLVEITIVKYNWYQAIWQGIKSAYYLTLMFAVALFNLAKNLILGGHVSGDIAGPVGIAVLTNQISKLGLVYIINFAAILSLNLAIINAIPFPALDGGRLLFLLIEKIKGSPVSQKIEQAVHMLGFALLILLMIVVTFRDIVRLF